MKRGLIFLVLLILACNGKAAILDLDDWRAKLPQPVLADHPGWIDFYYDTWRIAAERSKVYEGNRIFDTAFTDGKIWMWDTVWISYFGIYVQDAHPEIEHPMHGYDLFYNAQREDGGIPHVWDARGRHNWQVHNPIFSMGELHYYRHTGDKSRLSRVLPVLDRFYFNLKNRYRQGSGLYRSFDWNNGLDNRPRGWMSVDSTCEMAMVAEQLVEIAELVGDPERAAKFRVEHAELVKAINEMMWDEDDQFYTDANRRNEPENHWSVASYWALLSGVADAERAKIMRDHLFDPENFKTPMMVPTLGRKSKGYDADGGDYWRGSVWIPSNMMVIKGLAKYDYRADARAIAINGLEGMYETWKNTGTIWENYDQERPGKPGEQSKRDFVGWSGMQPIAILIEHIIGIEVNAPENTITWDLALEGENGIRNLKWGLDYGKTVSMVAGKMDQGERLLTVSSDSPFTLVVNHKGKEQRLEIKAAADQTFRF